MDSLVRLGSSSSEHKFVKLPERVKDALIGELLAAGHLRVRLNKNKTKPSHNGNAHLAMTLKSFLHVMYL
jgi:hypothetical protein